MQTNHNHKTITKGYFMDWMMVLYILIFLWIVGLIFALSMTMAAKRGDANMKKRVTKKNSK